MAIERAISIHELLSIKFKTMNLEGALKELIGVPERSGSWIVWGDSGNGKTRFTLQLVRELAKFGEVLYNPLEEGRRLSFQRAVKESNLETVAHKIKLLNKENMKQLYERLKKKRSAPFIVIDSIQYFTSDAMATKEITKYQYKKMLADFPNKLFVFISHADGKLPKGTIANQIRYDADIKIRIEGFKAFNIGRHGGGQPYTIWGKGAAEYWNEYEPQTAIQKSNNLIIQQSNNPTV